MMERHKYNIFPDMAEEDYDRLVNSMVQVGFDPLYPIIRYENKILDGWHRYKAATETATIPVFSEFKGSDADAARFVLASHARRNLNSQQWAVIAIKNEALLEAIQQQVERDKALALQGNDNRVPKAERLSKKLDDRIEDKSSHERDTDKLVADTYNTNRDYIRKAKKVKDMRPEYLDRVESGEWSLNDAYARIHKEDLEDKRKAYEERVKADVHCDRFIDIHSTDKKFRIVYADPPWQYSFSRPSNNGKHRGDAHDHYETLSIDELCELPVDAIIENNAVLFLWVTSPQLENSFEVIASWGFRYKASFVWDKVSHNMGHYNSVRHELLLICTRGSCTPDNKELFDSVQSIERSNIHSAKPPQFYKIIDTLYPYGDRIELFSRSPNTDHWYVWGDEV